MAVEKLEQELRTFFRCEAEAAAPPPDWWQGAVSAAVAHRQEANNRNTKASPARANGGLKTWFTDILKILHINPQKPLLGIATYLVLMVAVVSLSAGLSIYISDFLTTGGTPPTSTGLPPATTGGPGVTPTITVAIPQESFKPVVPLLIVISIIAGVLSIVLFRLRKKRLLIED